MMLRVVFVVFCFFVFLLFWNGFEWGYQHPFVVFGYFCQGMRGIISATVGQVI